MYYLFFDIECSDGIHICSFGYCLTDDKFNVIKKEDIVINPESKFILSKNKRRPKINLAYSEEFFVKQKNFLSHYPKIKDILCKENQIILGHSILSDFHFLYNACERYSLPNLELTGFDIQKLYQIYFNKKNVQSLESILNELNIENNKIRLHKSCDDAFATMLVAKRICEIEKISLDTIVNKYKDCFIDGRNLKIKNKKKSFNEEIAQLRKDLLKNCKLKIAFSEDFKTLSKKEKIEIIKRMFCYGYDFTAKVNECNIFVKGKEKQNREIYCDRLIGRGQDIKKLSFNEFLKMVETKNDLLRGYQRDIQIKKLG